MVLAALRRRLGFQWPRRCHPRNDPNRICGRASRDRCWDLHHSGKRSSHCLTYRSSGWCSHRPAERRARDRRKRIGDSRRVGGRFYILVDAEFGARLGCAGASAASGWQAARPVQAWVTMMASASESDRRPSKRSSLMSSARSVHLKQPCARGAVADDELSTAASEAGRFRCQIWHDTAADAGLERGMVGRCSCQ